MLRTMYSDTINISQENRILYRAVLELIETQKKIHIITNLFINNLLVLYHLLYRLYYKKLILESGR